MKVWKLIFSDRSLRYKFALSSVLPIMIVTVFIVIITINSLEKSIMEKTRIRAQGLTKLSALSMSNSFVIYNKDLLDNFVDSLAIERNIIYAMVVDSSDGRILAHSDHTHDGKIFSDPIGNDSLSTEQITSAIIAEKEHGEMYELFTPVIVRGIQYGVVRLGFSLEEVHQEIAFMKSEIMTIGALGIILGILSSIFLARIISKPIKGLAEQAERIGTGDFEQRMVYKSRDALGQLASSFNRMAEELKHNIGMLRENEAKYHALFEYSPISLWEQDLSEVKNYIDGLKERGVTDLRTYFADRPDEANRCINMIHILDVNRSTLGLYESDNKENFLARLKDIRTEKTREVLMEGIIGLAEGKPAEIECVYRTLTGREITVIVRSTIPPGYEQTWTKAFVSVQDLTERTRAEFLENMFGRYLSREVMNTLIENPEAIGLGGEKRNVTIMMTDLRGFTALSERLNPEQVVQMLNIYFEIMVEVVLQYEGTISEIIGDALLVIFGAPQEIPDRAQRAIACAIAMQNAMAEVHEQNRGHALPEIEMGIGINEAEVIVGNIGSRKRSKYGVVGSGVNMASRIESYSVGGQILISESTRKEAGETLRVDNQMEVHPKGTERPFTIYEVGGIGARYNLTLEEKPSTLVVLAREIPIRCTVLDGKHMGEDEFGGAILRLSRRSGELCLGTSLEPLNNLKLNLMDVSEELSRKDFYGKVVECSGTDPNTCTVQFTALPPGIDGYFQAALAQGARNHLDS